MPNKEIKIIASLDTSAIKKQMDALKKEFGESSFGQADLGDLKKAFQDIAKSFSKDIGDAIKEMKKAAGPGRSISSMREGRGAYDKEFISEARRKARDAQQSQLPKIVDKNKEFEAEQRKKAKEYLKDGEEKQKAIAKEAIAKAKVQQKEAKTREAALEKEGQKRLKQIEVEESKKQVAAQRAAMKLQQQVKEMQRLSSLPAAKMLSAMGFSDDTARGMAGFTENLHNRTVGRLPPGLAKLSAIGSAVGMASEAYGDIQDIRIRMAQRQFAFSQSLTQQKALQGAVEQAGRQELTPKLMGGAGGAVSGALKYGAMGALAGSMFGPAGTLVGGGLGLLGGGILGAVRGGTEASEKQAQLRREQTAPILEAVARAQALAPSRLSLAQGGNMTTQGMTGMQGRGTAFGFSPEETIQQALEARQFVGNKNVGTMLPEFQGIQRATGIEAGAQAQAAEVFAGAGGGGFAKGAQRQLEIIKKGVASGLDVSKSGQFLRATMEFVQQNAGMGRVDVEGIGGRLSQAAAGFAGGGEVTQADIQRAVSLQEMATRESTATGGLAGVGNLVGIQQAFSKAGQTLDTGTLLSLQNLGPNAKKEDIQQILQEGGVSADAMDQIMQDIQGVKQGGAGEAGANAVGLTGNLRRGLLSRERGIRTEEQLNIENAQNFQGPLQEGQISTAMETVKATDEFRKAVADAAVSQTQVVAGLQEFNNMTKLTNEGLKDLVSSLHEASRNLRDILGNSGISRTNH